MPVQSPSPSSSDAAGFAATRWTLVLAAARGKTSSQAADALAELCRIYWYPLYAYVRRRGYGTQDAEDLTQEFFFRLLAHESLDAIAPDKGKFRSFLLVALKHFLANEWDRAQARKRGGGQTIVSLDAPSAESRFRMEPSHDLTPEKLFERQWALTVLNRALSRLQEEFSTRGKAALFEGLKGFLGGGPTTASYADAGRALEMSEGAVKVAVHRLRRRYRELLRDEIAQTVSCPEEIEDEIRYLLSCL
jgi:RNA polymerase sigma-70 factor (ECF subfamily)